MLVSYYRSFTHRTAEYFFDRRIRKFLPQHFSYDACGILTEALKLLFAVLIKMCNPPVTIESEESVSDTVEYYLNFLVRLS
jgi:hypothetical protein